MCVINIFKLSNNDVTHMPKTGAHRHSRLDSG
jgi:hypothetical protein